MTWTRLTRELDGTSLMIYDCSWSKLEYLLVGRRVDSVCLTTPQQFQRKQPSSRLSTSRSSVINLSILPYRRLVGVSELSNILQSPLFSRIQSLRLRQLDVLCDKYLVDCLRHMRAPFLTSLDIPVRDSVVLQGICQLHWVPRYLKRLDITFVPMESSESMLAVIGEHMEALECLRIRFGPEDDWYSLRHVTFLRELCVEMWGDPMDSRGLAVIQEFKNLRRLDITCELLTEQVVQSLGAFPNLEVLNLKIFNVNSLKTLEDLSNLKCLKELIFYRSLCIPQLGSHPTIIDFDFGRLLDTGVTSISLLDSGFSSESIQSVKSLGKQLTSFSWDLTRLPPLPYADCNFVFRDLTGLESLAMSTKTIHSFVAGGGGHRCIRKLSLDVFANTIPFRSLTTELASSLEEFEWCIPEGLNYNNKTANLPEEWGALLGQVPNLCSFRIIGPPSFLRRHRDSISMNILNLIRGSKSLQIVYIPHPCKLNNGDGKNIVDALLNSLSLEKVYLGKTVIGSDDKERILHAWRRRHDDLIQVLLQCTFLMGLPAEVLRIVTQFVYDARVAIYI